MRPSRRPPPPAGSRTKTGPRTPRPTPGLSPAVTGSPPSPGALVDLQPDTTYYWKVGASDGYAFAGNATIWRFTTAGGSPNVMVGENRGGGGHGAGPLPDGR